MSYLSLYRKWRPRTFADIVGQPHIVKALTNAIGRDRLTHAYLFCGPRGTGKTSTARILAKSVNCLRGPSALPDDDCRICTSINRGNSLDVFEIDGASNRGIDDARELRENAKFAPSEGLKKFYIIDEAHMLTPEAFNALLKTLEEPPEHLVFVMATTEPHKLPGTISSRCQRYDFHRIRPDDIVTRLEEIAKAEGIAVDAQVLEMIAIDSKGSLRDAIGGLEQLSFLADGTISTEEARTLLGIQDVDLWYELADLILSGQPKEIFSFTAGAIDRGSDLAMLMKGFTGHLRRNMVAIHAGADPELIGVTPEEADRLTGQAARFKADHLYQCLEIAAQTTDQIRHGADERVWFELAAIKMLNARPASNRTLVEYVPVETAMREAGEIDDVRIEDKEADPSDTKEQGQEGLEPRASIDVKSIEAGEKADAASILQAWPKVLEKVKSSKISTYALLLECRPEAGEGGIELHFHDNADFHRNEIEKPMHADVIRSAIDETVGPGSRIDSIASAAKTESGDVPKIEMTAQTGDLVQMAKEALHAIVVDEQVKNITQGEDG